MRKWFIFVLSIILFQKVFANQHISQSPTTSILPVILSIIITLLILAGIAYFIYTKDLHTKEKPFVMQPIEHVSKYIAIQRSKDITDYVISQKLVQAGWSNDIIEQAFSQIPPVDFNSALLRKYDVTKDTYPPLSLYIRLLHYEGLNDTNIRTLLIRNGWPTKIIETELQEAKKRII